MLAGHATRHRLLPPAPPAMLMLAAAPRWLQGGEDMDTDAGGVPAPVPAPAPPQQPLVDEDGFQVVATRRKGRR